MDDKVMNHRGYQGSIKVSLEDKVLHGAILNINDLVTYEADSIGELEAAFIEAVDDYLVFCEEQGTAPDKPFSGSFNVRIGADLHKMAAMEANRFGINLNEFVKKAVMDAVAPRPRVVHNHYHGDTPHARGSWNASIDLDKKSPKVVPKLVVVK